MWLVVIGKVLEIGGLVLAARGLFLVRRHSASGAPLWPKLERALDRLLRRHRDAPVYETASDLSLRSASEYVEGNVDPSLPLGLRVTALEANLNTARRALSRLTSEIHQRADKLEAEDKRIERTFREAFMEESRQKSGHTVIELRTAISGLLLTALGVLIQLPQALGT